MYYNPHIIGACEIISKVLPNKVFCNRIFKTLFSSLKSQTALWKIVYWYTKDLGKDNFLWHKVMLPVFPSEQYIESKRLHRECSLFAINIYLSSCSWDLSLNADHNEISKMNSWGYGDTNGKKIMIVVLSSSGLQIDLHFD